jgi:hypothetical protein
LRAVFVTCDHGPNIQKASAAPTRILVAYKTVAVAKKDNSTMMAKATVKGVDITQLKPAMSLYDPHPHPAFHGYADVGLRAAIFVGVGVGLRFSNGSIHPYVQVSVAYPLDIGPTYMVSEDPLRTGWSNDASVCYFMCVDSSGSVGGSPGGLGGSAMRTYTW